MKSGKLRVALISGGLSGEREVSLNSGAQVYNALNPERYIVTRYDPATDLVKLMRDAPDLDVAVIILHGRYGEDGTIQGMLELVGLPYIGSGVMASSMCMDKRVSKIMYRQAGLTVPREVVLEKGGRIEPEKIIDEMGLPLVVKPACEGSSLGMSIPRSLEELAAGLEEAYACDRYVLIEEYIQGREITSSILGNDKPEALPLIEIVPGDKYRFFTYEAKYVEGATNEICPAPLTDDLAERARNIGLTAHRIMHCQGCSRTDMILKDDRFYVLETNTIPGMTETSLFPKAATKGGYTFGALMDRLIELAQEVRTHRAIRPDIVS